MAMLEPRAAGLSVLQLNTISGIMGSVRWGTPVLDLLGTPLLPPPAFRPFIGVLGGSLVLLGSSRGWQATDTVFTQYLAQKSS